MNKSSFMTLPKYPHTPNKGIPVHSPDELLLSEQLQLNVDDNMAYSARCHRRLHAKANTVITRDKNNWTYDSSLTWVRCIARVLLNAQTAHDFGDWWLRGQQWSSRVHFSSLHRGGTLTVEIVNSGLTSLSPEKTHTKGFSPNA